MFEGISYHLQYLVRSALVVGVWQKREMKGGQGESCLCFYHWCICSPLSSEGLTKGNNIGKIVFRSPRASETHCTLCFLPGIVL